MTTESNDPILRDGMRACPFCGGEPMLHLIEEGRNFGGQYIDCVRCGCATNLMFSVKEDCVPHLKEKWNKRATDALPVGEAALRIYRDIGRIMADPLGCVGFETDRAPETGGITDRNRIAIDDAVMNDIVRYPCGCTVTGGGDIPNYCPVHDAAPQPAAQTLPKVTALDYMEPAPAAAIDDSTHGSNSREVQDPGLELSPSRPNAATDEALAKAIEWGEQYCRTETWTSTPRYLEILLDAARARLAQPAVPITDTEVQACLEPLPAISSRKLPGEWARDSLQMQVIIRRLWNDNRLLHERQCALVAGIPVLRAELAAARAEIERKDKALDESVKLQGHYAMLLNMYDGGTRIEFKLAQEWLDRLAALAAKEQKE